MLGHWVIFRSESYKVTSANNKNILTDVNRTRRQVDFRSGYLTTERLQRIEQRIESKIKQDEKENYFLCFH